MKTLGFIALFVLSSLVVFAVSYCVGYKHGVKGMTDLFIDKQTNTESEDKE